MGDGPVDGDVRYDDDDPFPMIYRNGAWERIGDGGGGPPEPPSHPFRNPDEPEDL